MLFSLMFDILTYDVHGNTARCQQAKGSAPEIFFPQFFTDGRKFLFDKSAAGRFIGIDEFGQFRVGMGFQQYMYVVSVMVPFFYGYIVVRRNVLKYLFQTTRYRIIYDFPAIFYNQHQVIMQ